MGMSYHGILHLSYCFLLRANVSAQIHCWWVQRTLTSGTHVQHFQIIYLLEVHDDMQHIAKSVADVMLISKVQDRCVSYKLRATGSILKCVPHLPATPFTTKSMWIQLSTLSFEEERRKEPFAVVAQRHGTTTSQDILATQCRR